MSISVKYTVPLGLLHCQKGHLKLLREHLVSIGYPLASNEEDNVPDSVIRMKEGFHVVKTETTETHKIYHVARSEYEPA